MMAMLIRAGLPSRQAAMVAVNDGDGVFADGEGMRAWLKSETVEALTAGGAWPTPSTAALWNRFREETLTGSVRRWRATEVRRVLMGGKQRPANGTYRVEIDRGTGNVWICTPDYRRLCRLRSRVRDTRSAFYAAKFSPGDNRALIQRFGVGQAEWQIAEA
jgi:hypothetical protein